MLTPLNRGPLRNVQQGLGYWKAGMHDQRAEARSLKMGVPRSQAPAAFSKCGWSHKYKISPGWSLGISAKK